MLSAKTEQRLRLLGVILRIAVGALFVLSGSIKILSPIEEFQGLVREYQLLPEMLVGIFSIALPIVEVVVGLCMILGLFERASTAVVAGMLVMFIIAITQGLARGFALENCGCFGALKFGDTPQQVLFRDWVLLAVTALLVAHPPKRYSLDNIL